MGDYGSDDDAVHFPDYGNEEGGQDPRWAPPPPRGDLEFLKYFYKPPKKPLNKCLPGLSVIVRSGSGKKIPVLTETLCKTDIFPCRI